MRLLLAGANSMDDAQSHEEVEDPHATCTHLGRESVSLMSCRCMPLRSFPQGPALDKGLGRAP